MPNGAAVCEKWNMIPAGIDVLMTHGPPAGQLQTLLFTGTKFHTWTESFYRFISRFCSKVYCCFDVSDTDRLAADRLEMKRKHQNMI